MERRLAAILSADMVGFSRLMEIAEEETIARQKTLRHELIDPRIAGSGGRVVKTISDRLLVEFPSAVKAVRCAIADRRKGVPPARCEEIFQRFWRGDRRDDSGAGLGLSIVKRAVDSIGGTVRIEDAPGGAACFALELRPSGGAADLRRRRALSRARSAMAPETFG